MSSVNLNFDIGNCRGIDNPAYLVASDVSEAPVGDFQPFSIGWKDLNVRVEESKSWVPFQKTLKGPLQIVRNLSGTVESGHNLAILGSSGSGKTTLLNTLTGRNMSNLRAEGHIFLNGELASTSDVKSISSYVQQDDIFIGVLTVKEHLTFQATLRSSKDNTKEMINRKVEKLLSELSLTRVADIRINCESSGQHISGGETKRLSIATEILNDPAILFLDEPTTGLDSYMATSVISALNSMARSGRTILCTIHQPSSEIFAMFNEILLLAEGRTAFMGTVKNALTFFSSLDYQCPSTHNPSDFFIRKLAVIPGKETECQQEVEKICNSYANSDNSDLKNPLKVYGGEAKTIRCAKKLPKYYEYRRSIGTQFSCVFKRAILANIREPMITVARIINVIFTASLIGLVYWRQNYDQKGVQNISGAVFVVLANTNFLCIFVVIQTFCTEVNVFVRETNSGLYRVSVYYWAKILAELPYFFVLPAILMSLVYWMVGLYDDWIVFLLANAIIILVANTASGFGYLISTVSPSVNFALQLSGPVMTPLFLFGGFFINNLSIPFFLAWIKYISWFYYGNEIISVNQWYKVDHIDCEYEPKNSSVPAPGCVMNGRGVIKVLGFNEDHVLMDFISILLVFSLFKVLSYVCLWARAKMSR